MQAIYNLSLSYILQSETSIRTVFTTVRLSGGDCATCARDKRAAKLFRLRSPNREIVESLGHCEVRVLCDIIAAGLLKRHGAIAILM